MRDVTSVIPRSAILRPRPVWDVMLHIGVAQAANSKCYYDMNI